MRIQLPRRQQEEMESGAAAGGPPPAAAASDAADTTPPAASNGPATAVAGPLPHPSEIGGAYHAILRGLGGDNVTYQRDDSGTLREMHSPATPGQQWKHIIAGALTGLAAAGATRPGPGYKQRALAASVGAGLGRAQGEQQRGIDLADKDFDAQQKVTIRKAQQALLTQQMAESSFRLARLKVDAGFQDAERENAFSQMVQSGGSSNKDLGTFTSVADAIAAHKEMPDLLQQQAHGNILAIPHIEDGQIKGMRVALVTPEWKAQKLDHDETFYKLAPPAKAGLPPKLEKHVVKAGTLTNGEFMQAQQAANLEVNKFYDSAYTQQQETARTQYREGQENTRAAERNETAKAIAQGKTDVAGRKLGQKDVDALNKRNDSLLRAQVQLENASDKELSSEGFFQRLGVTPPPQGVDKRKAALAAITAERAGIKQKLDEQMGLSAAPPAGPPPPAKNVLPQGVSADTHSFSVSAWQKANPKGDVEAAKKAAQQAGLPIVD